MGTGERAVQLDADGGRFTWELPMAERPDFECHTKRGERLGKGYVKLTSGKKVFFTFPLLEEEAYRQLAVVRENA